LLTWLQREQTTSVVPTWQRTTLLSTGHALKFFSRSHDVWFACRGYIVNNTITSVMYALIWNELDVAFKQAMLASYQSSARALRYVLEFAVQAAILEQKYVSLKEGPTKLNTAFTDPIFQGFHVKMIDQLGMITTKEQADLRKLYHELSIFGSHVVASFLATLKMRAIWNTFDRRLFVQCDDSCRQVIDLVLLVLFAKYPGLMKDKGLKTLAKQLGLVMALKRMPQ
jgi:hypothetical protein